MVCRRAAASAPVRQWSHVRRLGGVDGVGASAIKGQKRTHLVTGYVHKPYRDTYCMLAKHLGYDSLLLVRGTEGGIIPSFRAAAHVVRYDDHAEYEELDHELAPLDLLRDYRAEDIPDTMPAANSPPHPIGMKWDIDALAQLCAERGREALAGKAGAVYDAAVLGAALIVWHCGQAKDLSAAVKQARAVIASGEALERLDAGL